MQDTLICYYGYSYKLRAYSNIDFNYYSKDLSYSNLIYISRIASKSINYNTLVCFL